MYQSAYAEQFEEMPQECRDRERRAFDRAIELLRDADQVGASSAVAEQAFHFVCRLWQALIEDLATPDNDLPDILKRDLISIGIWVVKEVEAIRRGKSTNLRGLIDICTIVREGLK
jgi:flagellar protein FlaF